VYEGATSIGMRVRGTDEYHSSMTYLTNQSQVYWHGATNLTLDAEWYLNSIGNPVNEDYFRIEIAIDNKLMYYYLGCETTAGSNYSTSANFNIGGPLQTWNHLHRNISSDYFAVFGVEPDYYKTMYWKIISYTNEYTEVYIDDIYLVNSSLVKIGGSVSGGNFEGGGGWTFQSGQGAGDIAQCTNSHSGSSSMNLTTLTFDDTAYAYAYYQPRKLLTAENQANLSFWWNLENYSNPTNSMWARISISLENTTWQSTFYYYLFVGGSGQLPFIIIGNDMNFVADGFNGTESWNFFNRNIWEDFNSMYPTENLWVEQINFQVRTWEDNAKLSLLVDDINFSPSILSDMDYEHQNAVGENIQGWESPPGSSKLTVTNFASSGSKAMNLTLTDDESDWESQKIGNLPIDSTTELILDFNVYIDTFNTSSEDYVFFQLDFNDDYMYYVIVNSTSAFEDELSGEGVQNFVILQETVTTGEWLNFQRDIVHDYELLFGSEPDDNLGDIELAARSNTGSSLTVIFDDMYIYYDTAPEITSVDQMPTTVSEAGESVRIMAEVVDASALTVTLSYRVDAGTWTNVTMNESTSDFRIDINAPYGVSEYFVTAMDAFGKTDVALNGSEYFTFTTVDTIAPIITLTPANDATVSDIVSIEITVQDSGSGFAGSELFINGTSIANISLDTVGISWDTTGIPDGEYNITVVAEDNAGNIASITHIVTVDNVVTPSGDLTGVILIAVIIVALGVVLVIYVFVVKKR